MSERADRRTFDFLARRRAPQVEVEVNPTPSGLELVAILSASATLDFPNTAAQQSSDLTLSVPGAVVGDVVVLGTPNASMQANSSYFAWVSAANTVTCRLNNYSAGAIDPASGVFIVAVFRFR